MKFVLLLMITLVSLTNGNTQSLDSLKTEKGLIKLQLDSLQSKVDSLKKISTGINDQIEKASGYIFGLGGNVGFGIRESNNWIGNDNPNSTSSTLTIAINAFANKIKEKTIFRNNIILHKQWQDTDLKNERNEDHLFENGVVDIFNLSTLYGYRVSEKLSMTGSSELDSKLQPFIDEGTFDLGIGMTYNPIKTIVLTIHPLTYQFAFSGQGETNNVSSIGTKIKAEYNNKISIIGKTIAMSSVFTSFLPYNNNTTIINPDDLGIESWDAGPFKYSIINSFSFNIWYGVGVGVSFGVKKAEYQSQDLQTYYSMGLNYTM